MNGAIGGSTNAVVHLLAIAGRVGIPLSLEDWDSYGRNVPTLLDLKPSGRFLMEDFHYAGGLPAVIRTLGEAGLINREAMTVNGKTIWENCQEAPAGTEVFRPVEPAGRERRIAVLRGKPGADWRVIKPSAASPQLMKHRAAPSCSNARAVQGPIRTRSRRRRVVRAGASEQRPGAIQGWRGRQQGLPPAS